MELGHDRGAIYTANVIGRRRAAVGRNWVYVLLLAHIVATVLSLSVPPFALAYPANSYYGQIIPNELYVTIYDHKLEGAHDAQLGHL